MAVLVDVENAGLSGLRVGALPIVAHYLERIGIKRPFDHYVHSDQRAILSPSAPLVAMVANLVIERTPSPSSSSGRPRVQETSSASATTT